MPATPLPTPAMPAAVPTSPANQFPISAVEATTPPSP